MTTLGKFRHLSRVANAAGHFVVLAIDHRANLLTALNQHAAQPLSDADFSAFKQAVLNTPDLTAVLTDPAYGIGAGIAGGALHGRVGLLAPIEVTNYDLSPDQRQVQFIPHWSVEKIKRVGGDGVKLLLSYHPDAPDADEKRALVRQIVDQCGKYDIPFFLEPIPFALTPAQALTTDELSQVTVHLTREFCAMGVDVLKLHFPANTEDTPDPARWKQACEAVNAVCSVPWALLSAGVPYAAFLQQAQIACEAGASGVIVGRAVWNEAVTLQGEDRAAFLRDVVPQRMAELTQLCATFAHPWQTRVSPPQATLDWYEND